MILSIPNGGLRDKMNSGLKLTSIVWSSLSMMAIVLMDVFTITFQDESMAP